MLLRRKKKKKHLELAHRAKTKGKVTGERQISKAL